MAAEASITETAPAVSLEIATDPPGSAPAKVSILTRIHGIVVARGKIRCLLLVASMLSMSIGFTAGALLSRSYFNNGGNRKWLSTWLQSSGWPLLALVTFIIYWQQGLKPTPLNPGLALSYLLLGILTGLDNLLFAWGIAYLPSSTFGLLCASQLAFNAIFALAITRQKITAFGWNAIVLVSASAVLLALHSDNDKLPGVSTREYITGYIVTIGASALYGLIYPLTEITFRKHLAGRSNVVVLEMQLSFCIIATIFSTIGMAVNHDFEAAVRESGSFRAGGTSGYCLNLVLTAVCWQLGTLGATGVIFLSSSLLAGVVLTVGIPLLSIFAVIFFHDSFGGLKIMSMLLSVWGFVSYLYGGYLEDSSNPKSSL